MIKNIRPRLTEAGKIKIGGLGEERPKQGGGFYRLPQKYDFFKITTNMRTESGDLEIDDQIMKGLPRDKDGKIRAIPIVLHSDEIDKVFTTSYALYSGRRCACRGDGETAVAREIKDRMYTGREKDKKCPCDYLKASKGPMCKPNGKFFCSIVAPGSFIAGAVHIWRTTSIISIEQMIGSLTQIKSICGTLRGIPLWLRVKPVVVEPPGQGILTVYCCHVELHTSDIATIQHKALETASMRRSLGTGVDSEYMRMATLPGDGETEDEGKNIAKEFYGDDKSNRDDEPPPSGEESSVEPRDDEPPPGKEEPTIEPVYDDLPYDDDEPGPII